MIISFHRLDEVSETPTILYMCTRCSFERMMEEIASMEIDDLVGDDGVGPIDNTEPFMLDHIYLN